MLFDTEFLIAASGQRGKPLRGRALAFLASRTEPLFTSRGCWSEFAEGYTDFAAVNRDLALYAVLEVDETVAWQASRLARALKASGQPIADNDFWIAATALEFGLPLVSNNKKHFARIPGLDLRNY
jgi:predicted nucleic acid-binding protein